jgi:hypothetical protein
MSMTMETYPVGDKTPGRRAYAFEVENAYLEPGTIVRLLTSVVGVTHVRERGLFSGSKELHAEFRYMNRDYVVCEPSGENTRYWIGPRTQSGSAVSIGLIEDVFKRYRPPLRLQLIGDLMSLTLVKHFVGPYERR